MRLAAKIQASVIAAGPTAPRRVSEKQATKKRTGISNWFNEKTVPFGGAANAKGAPRLLANADFMEVAKRVAEAKRDMSTLLDRLKGDYGNMVLTAKAKLGTSYDRDNYPEVDDLASRFTITVEFMPLPASGQFRGLPEDTTQALDDYIERKLKEKSAHAGEIVAARIGRYIGHLKDRIVTARDAIASGEAGAHGLREALFEHAKEVRHMVDSFGPLLPEDVANHRAAIEGLLDDVIAHDVESLKGDAAALDALDKRASSFDCFDI